MVDVRAQRVYPLDAAIATTAARPDDDPRAWAPRRALTMLAATVAVIVVFGGVVGGLNPTDLESSWATVAGEGLLAIPVVVYARRAVHAAGGWGAGLGLTPPRWSDLPIAIGWVIVQFIARFAAGLVLLGLLPAARHERVSNVPTLADKPWTVLLPLIVAVVVFAPIVEELAFRGFMLRSFTRAWGFRAAAVATGVLFGLLHFEQAGGPAASVILAGTLAVFGYLQAVLVRRTARLAPAMIVHGLNNAVSITLALHLHLH